MYCDEWELTNGKDEGQNEFGIAMWSFPDSMEVVVENIDDEILAKKDKEEKLKAAISRVKAHDEDQATANQKKQFTKDLQLLILSLL